MASKATVIAVVNQKGGTAKTTTCENLGVGLAMEGKKVLCIDMDPQASLTIALGWQRPDDLNTTEVIEETTFIPDSASEVEVEEVVEKATETVTQAEAAPAPRKRGRPRMVVQEAPAEVKEESVTETTTTPAADKELLLKLLEKPEMAQLLKALAQTL